MNRVGVRELKQNTSRVLRRVREKKERIQVTYRGEVVALLVPVPQRSRPAEANHDEAVWAELDQLAAEISARWPKGVSAVQAIREDRSRP
jgi:prevent-host-death family protein